MNDLDRQSLAEEQTTLARALTQGGQAPHGFDPDRIRLAARMLVAKRRKIVAGYLPETVKSLAGRFVPLFFRYANNSGIPTQNPASDALQFTDSFSHHRMSDAAKLEVFMLDLHVRARWGWIRLDSGSVFGCRLPFVGVARIHLPIRRRNRPASQRFTSDLEIPSYADQTPSEPEDRSAVNEAR